MGHLFTYVNTCERGRVKGIEQRWHVYNAVRYNAFFPRGPRRPCYNGVAVYPILLFSNFYFLCQHIIELSAVVDFG